MLYTDKARLQCEVRDVSGGCGVGIKGVQEGRYRWVNEEAFCTHGVEITQEKSKEGSV